jgi:hypothetical protein
VEEGEHLSLDEGLRGIEGNHWAEVLEELEAGQQEEAPEELRLFGRGHAPKGDEVFVAGWRAGEQGGREEQVVHVALEGEVISINVVSALQAMLFPSTLLTLLQVFFQLTLL